MGKNLVLKWFIEEETQEEEKAIDFLCATCIINDDYLHNSAAKHNLLSPRACARCGSTIEKGLSLEYIAKKINEHLHKHYEIVEPQDDVGDLISLQDIVKRFVIDDDKVIQLISEILYKLSDRELNDEKIYKDRFDQNARNELTTAILDEWNNYAFELKHLMRFTNNKAIDFYESVIYHCLYPNGNKDNNDSPMFKVISIGTEFYRGRRVSDNKHREQLEQNHKEFYAPPPEKAANNRMSPPGMSFLYTAKDQKTCIVELHPFAGDEIAVVKLETKRTLYFFDLTRAVDVKYESLGLICDPAAKLYASRYLLSHLHDLIAKPFRATDISYIAIQAFAETVRHYDFSHNGTQQKFDGIIFNSTQMKGGLNYAFFGDKTSEHRTESPLENYGLKPSEKTPVKFYKIDSVQVNTSPYLVDK